jgi:site-specific DNA-cytosine methylase
MKAISLFSSAGVGETYLKDIGIDVVVGAELIKKRAELHKHLYPDSEVIIGDISKIETKEKTKNQPARHKYLHRMKVIFSRKHSFSYQNILL